MFWESKEHHHLDFKGNPRTLAGSRHLDVVDVVAKVVVAAGVVAVDFVELDVVVVVASDKVDGLVDLNGLGELAVGLQVTSLIGWNKKKMFNCILFRYFLGGNQKVLFYIIYLLDSREQIVWMKNLRLRKKRCLKSKKNLLNLIILSDWSLKLNVFLQFCTFLLYNMYIWPPESLVI